MFNPEEHWEFNSLGIYDYKRPGEYDLFYEDIRQHLNSRPGNIIECGVYNGRTLLATALLLREMNSDKIVVGFDSFTGFPNLDQGKTNINDELDAFNLFATPQQKLRISRLIEIKSLSTATKLQPYNISSSMNFRSHGLEILKKKILFLGLSNVTIIEGYFSETMNKSYEVCDQIFSVFMDCDLYSSYLSSLNFVWENTSIGGLVYLDEYYSLKFPGCKIAVDQFLADKKFTLITGSGKVGD